MTVSALIAGIVLFFVALVIVMMPLVQQRRSLSRANMAEQKKRDELLTSYERVLETIRDLDEDHQTGKLDPETYQREREYWTEQGIVFLQQLDPDGEELPVVQDKVEEPDNDEADEALSDAIEQAIANYRGVKA